MNDDELNRRRALSNAMDDEIDILLDKYKAASIAEGIEPTPRTPAPRQPKATPRRAITRPPTRPGSGIKRPPGAVKG